VLAQVSDGKRHIGPYLTSEGSEQSNARLTGRKRSTIVQLPAIRYPCKVPAIQVKRPRTRLELIRDT
jgi:hypothetical protein